MTESETDRDDSKISTLLPVYVFFLWLEKWGQNKSKRILILRNWYRIPIFRNRLNTFYYPAGKSHKFIGIFTKKVSCEFSILLITKAEY